jgi:hypothetical protein
LGDEKFVDKIEERIQDDREIARPVPRAKLSILLPLIARAYGATEKDLVQAGCQPYALRAGLGSFARNQSDDNVSI